ncbi:TlyA family RNA methyltransferase [Candidatus Saccharibacteria bacterium CPR2]|nr:TlyA family RNA methyltransferase [Candidatus Saccharibacteria bacterium CPR2]
MKRLDLYLFEKGKAATRSQAESLIRMGAVFVNGEKATKPGAQLRDNDKVTLSTKQQYVSRGGYKLESVSRRFKLDLQNKIVLDVGSSTGGFTDFALQNGAKKVIAVDVGTNQMHPALRNDPRVELHEKTNILEFGPSTAEIGRNNSKFKDLTSMVDVILIDLSFTSIRPALKHIISLSDKATEIVAMVKPQFEAGDKYKHKGVIKNERIRRDILKNFEEWIKQYYVIVNKADSQITGEKGNKERFYLLRLKP